MFSMHWHVHNLEIATIWNYKFHFYYLLVFEIGNAQLKQENNEILFDKEAKEENLLLKAFSNVTKHFILDCLIIPVI